MFVVTITFVATLVTIMGGWLDILLAGEFDFVIL
jgi:hypothetical protein